MNTRFGTIASGSSGNCAYAGLGGEHFLIDAGISGKKIAAGIERFAVPKLSGILVTHEHSDHVRGLGIAARRFKVPVYATPLTWRYFLRHGTIGPMPEELVKHVEPNQPFTIGDVKITAFDIPHDASQPVGYTLQAGEEKIAIATDLGEATDTIRTHMQGAGLMYIESNHDIEMVKNGRYHISLKQRVLSARGHLSNAACGVLLADICGGLASHLRPHVLLAHLSEENNRPMLAYDTVLRVLDGHEVKVRRLAVAERDVPGELIFLS
ncbi:MAG: MBL fold metallo-hydrolase [Defluviitaleaceae bacterium]|nr:MBL fold metallo-hydrolase [Defluviitaleaceae bacterium]MCL2274957.1 MBL fold metallo-hydrolase [Defluviitaleaceae bacterium]